MSTAYSNNEASLHRSKPLTFEETVHFPLSLWPLISADVCVCLCPFLFPTRGGRTWALSPECKTYQADFTNWMSFLQSKLE